MGGFLPQRLISLYTLLNSQKAFTLSPEGLFFMIFSWFECEGLNFQVFTEQVAKGERREGLEHQAFTRFRPLVAVCECFMFQPFTPETPDYEGKTGFL